MLLLLVLRANVLVCEETLSEGVKIVKKVKQVTHCFFTAVLEVYRFSPSLNTLIKTHHIPFVKVEAMKIGAKEMKKAYKQVRMDDIEVWFPLHVYVLIHL